MANDAIETPDDQPRTVAELLHIIARERGHLEHLVAGLSDAALTATSEGWSIKDHLAHVAAWERRLIGEIEGDRAAERFGLDGDAFAAMDTNSLNAMIHERYRNAPPDAVRAEFLAAGEAIRATIAGLTDAGLLQPVRPHDPGVDTLLDLISWDTYRHYPEHVATIASRA